MKTTANRLGTPNMLIADLDANKNDPYEDDA